MQIYQAGYRAPFRDPFYGLNMVAIGVIHDCWPGINEQNHHPNNNEQYEGCGNFDLRYNDFYLFSFVERKEDEQAGNSKSGINRNWKKQDNNLRESCKQDQTAKQVIDGRTGFVCYG